MKKFNKFDLVYESALKRLVKEENSTDSKVYSHGLKVGTTLRLKPSFFTQSEASKVMDDVQLDALKKMNDMEYDRCQHFFEVSAETRENAGPNMKSANDLNTLNRDYNVLSAAERHTPIYKFIRPSKDIKHVDILDWDGNLPPVLSPKNPYSFYDAEKGKTSQVNDKDFQGLANSPIVRSLPTQNTKL